MEKILKKKKQATGAFGYLFMFMTVLIVGIITLYMAQVSKLMTHQHHVDDSLADAVLASLVADDVYYFKTYELTGTPVVRFRDKDESYAIFKDCMNDAVSDTDGFYYNFGFDTFICYEVEGNTVKATEYSGNGGYKRTWTARVGAERAPTGEVVKETSAYGRVRFGIKSIINGNLITKTKDIYCTLEINN